MGYEISDKVSQFWNYEISHDEVTDIDLGASLAIKEQEGASVKSLIGQALLYDARDSRVGPTEGFLARYNIDLAGMGGSVKFVRNKVKAIQYFPIADQVTLSISGNAGLIIGFGQDTRIIDRFFLGGASLRGFTNSGVGPRDTVTDDAVGGRWVYGGSLQTTFPMGLPNELGILGQVFGDIGSSGNSDTDVGTIRDTKSLRAAMGVGISWKSPFGPIAIEWSTPLLKEDFDKTESLRFDFGARF